MTAGPYFFSILKSYSLSTFSDTHQERLFEQIRPWPTVDLSTVGEKAVQGHYHSHATLCRPLCGGAGNTDSAENLRWEKAMGLSVASGGSLPNCCCSGGHPRSGAQDAPRSARFFPLQSDPNRHFSFFQSSRRNRSGTILILFLLLAVFCDASISAAEVFDPPKDGKLLSAPVNLRSGPSLSDAVVGNIEGKEAPVLVLEKRENWVKIRIGEQEGWLFQALVAIEEEKAPEKAAAETAPAGPSPASPPEPAPEPKAEKAPAEGPPAARVEPDQTEDVAVMIREIEFSGNKVIDTETLQAAAKDYRGRELTLKEMGELVDRITITYQERGYILARAYLPKQDISDGVLQIAVMEGNIGKIEVAGKTHYDEKLVKKYFESQLSEGVVKESALEKGLLLANDLPDLKTNVVLRKGEKAGDVDVVVNTEDSSRLTLGVEIGFDYNNFGSELTSRNRYGTTIRVVDHKWGTITDLRGVIGDNINDSFLGSVDFSAPIGSYGTRVAGGYLYGNYIVGQNFADLGLDGYTKIAGARISHPLIKKKNQNLNFTLGWENKYTKNYILEQERSIDQVNVVYGAFSFDNLDRFLGKNIVNASASFGEVAEDDRIATSRTDSAIHYERINASYARVQKLFGYTNLFLRGAGQYSNDRLLPIEEFVIGGYGTVRGYDPALYLGDSGYTLTAEVMFAPPYPETVIKGIRLGESLQFALFYDDGYVSLNDEIPGEVGTRHLSGWGGGFRIFYKDRFYFKYDIGFPLIRIPGKDTVFHYFQVGYQLF